MIFDGRFRDWDQSSPRYEKKLIRYSSDELFDYYRCEIEHRTARFRYFFLVEDGNERLYYTAYGFQREIPAAKKCFEYKYICEGDYFQTPAWARKAVFYQIFPERFCSGDKNLNPSGIKNWDERIPDRDSFYGGDLAGIIKKLDYLDDLGIDALYLTPIFKSESNHKYDIIDYKQVDPHFGDLETARELVEKAHRRGMRVILDGVFNHTSDKFFAFQDVKDKGRDSDYVDWYYIYDFPVEKNPNLGYDLLQKLFKLLSRGEIDRSEIEDELLPQLDFPAAAGRKKAAETAEYLLENYETEELENFRHIMDNDSRLREILGPNYESFAGRTWSMPKLRVANPEVRKYILDVARYWLEEVDIDGWRLDVADEVEKSFWREFRRTVKEIKPEALIVGEVWTDASPWLQGDQFDGTMNYLFTEAVLDFFCRRKIDARTFKDRLSSMRASYKLPALQASLNLLGSHDTERILHVCEGDKKRQKLSAAFQMCYPGAPMIYYGDEVGMTGGDDPDCRRPMIWDKDKQDQKLFSWYRDLIRIRQENPALQEGEMELLEADAVRNLYCFARRRGDNQIITLFNNSSTPVKKVLDLSELSFEIKGDSLVGLISERSYAVENKSLELKIGEYGVRILKVT